MKSANTRCRPRFASVRDDASSVHWPTTSFQGLMTSNRAHLSLSGLSGYFRLSYCWQRASLKTRIACARRRLKPASFGKAKIGIPNMSLAAKSFLFFRTLESVGHLAYMRAKGGMSGTGHLLPSLDMPGSDPAIAVELQNAFFRRNTVQHRTMLSMAGHKSWEQRLPAARDRSVGAALRDRTIRYGRMRNSWFFQALVE